MGRKVNLVKSENRITQVGGIKAKRISSGTPASETGLGETDEPNHST
jgi:hypothetical protein